MFDDIIFKRKFFLSYSVLYSPKSSAAHRSWKMDHDHVRSISARGCNPQCMVISLRVFLSREWSSSLVQFIIAAVYLITGTTLVLMADILFLPDSFDLRINLILLIYSSWTLFLTFWWLISSFSNTPRYL